MYILPEKIQKDLITFLSNYPYRDTAHPIAVLMNLKKYEAPDIAQETFVASDEPKG